MTFDSSGHPVVMLVVWVEASGGHVGNPLPSFASCGHRRKQNLTTSPFRVGQAWSGQVTSDPDRGLHAGGGGVVVKHQLMINVVSFCSFTLPPAPNPHLLRPLPD